MIKIFLKITLFITSFANICSLGQTPTPLPTQIIIDNEGAPIKVNTLLVNIPVIANDKAGHHILGLTKDNFVIYEDGKIQPIAFFADEQSPMNVAILIDCSASTNSITPAIQDAAQDFLKVFRPEDQGLIAGFSNQTYIFSEFTSDQKKLQKAIDKTGKLQRGGSNMLDGIYRLVTERFNTVKGRKAIIALTDGVVGGNVSYKELLSKLEESDVIIYPILFRNAVRVGGIEMWKEQTKFMDSIAAVTAGRVFKGEIINLKKIFQNIADELKSQYVIGYYPQNSDDGQSHKIAVESISKDIVIRTKVKE